MENSFAHYLDFANHSPAAVETDISILCQKVQQYDFNAAFMNPSHVGFAKTHYPTIKVGTIISFPLGQDTLDIKVAAAEQYTHLNADELDVSLNVSYLKEAQWEDSLHEMKVVVDAVKSIDDQTIVKFILETGFLTVDEIKKGSELIVESGADFIKTNSGMGPTGARLEDLPHIKAAVGETIRVKVAGGVSTRAQAEAFIHAGAVRIGTSKAIDILLNQTSTPPIHGSE